MKIGIDMRPFFTGSKYRGIGNYSKLFIEELIKAHLTDEFHFFNIYGNYDCDLSLTDHCYIHNYCAGPSVIDGGDTQLLNGSLFEPFLEAQVKHFLMHSQIDAMLFLSPSEYGGILKSEWFSSVGKIAILYDLIPLIFPKQCLRDVRFKEDYEKSLLFLKDMDLLLAISNSAKEDAVKHLHIPAEKIAVIYAGISEVYQRLEKINIAVIKEKFNIKDSFILFAGGIDFKKNIEGLIKAYSLLENKYISRYQLVITGKLAEDTKRSFYNCAEAHGVGGRVLCIGFISKEDLVALYNIAEMLVFPSFYEGFGLPVLEAMACGTSVVTAKNSSLTEVAGEYAVFVDPAKPKSIAEGIEYVLNNPVNILDLKEKAVDNAKSYTWEKSAALASKAIEEAAFSARSIDYNFSISDELLHNIVLAYINNEIYFDQNQRDRVAECLYTIEHKLKRIIYPANARILYDFTVVHDWLKSKYSTGIGRTSIELFHSIRSKYSVVPVIVDEAGMKVLDMESLIPTTEKVEIKAGDIYFMPELQLRGIQIKKTHPFADELRRQGAKTYAIIYDILPLQFPQYFEGSTAKSYDSYVREIVANYDGGMCISRTVMDDMVAYAKANDISLLDFHLGYFHLGSNSFKKNANANAFVAPETQHFIEHSNVFLMVGTVEPRKGHEQVLKAFDEKWKQGSEDKILIIGHVGWNMNKFIYKLRTHAQYGKNLLYIEGANDATLLYAYKNCSALIQASAGEGFGLPLIEAGEYNLPILCSDIAVFKEVAREHALYFDRGDVNSIISAIEKFKELRDNGKLPLSSEIKPISWSESANKILDMIILNNSWEMGE